MQNLWQRKLKLNYSKEVFDIVQFGSSLFENSKPNDIDIAVIFMKIPIKEQLNQAQDIKEQIEKYVNISIHLSSFDLYSLLDESNFAKESILFYGKSLISGESFARKFGLNPKLQVAYSLVKLPKKDKVRLHYTLSGKGGKYGLLNKYKGRLINPGLIEIDPLYEEIIIEAIKKITQDVKVKKILALI